MDNVLISKASRSGKTTLRPLGCLPGSVDVPQVKAAIRLLTHDGQPLAAFDERGRCISAGAYLDPRRETGEVVLELLAEHRPTAGRDELRAERVRVTLEYADLFRVAGWTVQEFREPDHTGRERLARLILTPPPAAPAELAAIADLHGRFVDGYTPEDINSVFGRITDAGGPRLVCAWDYVDEYGFGGNSEFFAETERGLCEVSPAVHQWLSGWAVSPGAMDTWVCALVSEPVEFAGGDDFHNFARSVD